VTTMYCNDTIVNSLGLPHEPKYTHLYNLHQVLEMMARLMLSQNPPKPIRLKENVEAFCYSNICYFLVNSGSTNVTLTFKSQQYFLFPDSVLVLDSAGRVIYDSAIIYSSWEETNNTKAEKPNTNAEKPNTKAERPTLQRVPLNFYKQKNSVSKLKWKWWSEFEESQHSEAHWIASNKPIEQLSLTHDLSDYCLYFRNVSISCCNGHSRNAVNLTIHTTHGSAMIAYIRGSTTLAGHEEDLTHWVFPKWKPTTLNLTLNETEICRYACMGGKGKKKAKGPSSFGLYILSVSLGIQNNDHAAGAEMTLVGRKGLLGEVMFGHDNITEGKWEMRPKLIGEWMKVFTLTGSSKVHWSTNTSKSKGPMTWFQTLFTLKDYKDSLAIELSGMNRGHAYVNGHHIGRYSLVEGRCKGRLTKCEHFDEGSCGKPTQRLYHIPPDWLSMNSANLLTLFEQLGSNNVSRVKLVQFTSTRRRFDIVNF